MPDSASPSRRPAAKARQGGLFAERELPRVALAEAAGATRGLADGVSRRIRLGTCSWSFPGWQGLVYGAPASQATLARHGLATYARHPLLRTVSLDRGYYAPIPATDLERYVDQVPADFRFVVKAPEDCCWWRMPRHPRYGERAAAQNPRFLEAGYAREEVVRPLVDGLGARLGAVLFQFPPQSARGALAPARFAESLHAFFRGIAAEVPLAVEFRTEGWLTPVVADALADVGVRAALTWHPRMPGLAEQARLLERQTPGPLIVRWMLRAGDRYEEARDRYAPFDRRVDPDPAACTEIAEHVREADGQGRESLILINNKAEGSAPASAVALAQALADGDPPSSDGDW